MNAILKRNLLVLIINRILHHSIVVPIVGDSYRLKNHLEKENLNAVLQRTDRDSILNDETHSDYREMVKWGRMQGYRPFDFEWVNVRLRGL